MSTEQFLLSTWTLSPVVLTAAGVSLAAYLFAFRSGRRISWFLLALVVFVLTLVSPLNALAEEYLFSAHMLQHIVVLLIVPGLLLLSLPRSFSLAWRPRLLAHPLAGWIAGVGAMWVWHWPTLCNAAVTSRPVYALQTVSLLVFGTLFWSHIIAPREEERLSPPGAVLYLFSACVTCSALGIILTFSPVTVCSIYAMPVGDRLGMWEMIRTGWGFTPDKDQQIGGLLMWVPMCLIYLGAIFAQIARGFGEAPVTRPAT
jgi:putative membrane protein